MAIRARSAQEAAEYLVVLRERDGHSLSTYGWYRKASPELLESLWQKYTSLMEESFAASPVRALTASARTQRTCPFF
jgi:hypothetical protein